MTTVDPSMTTPGPVTVPTLPTTPIGVPVVTVPAKTTPQPSQLPFTGADAVQIGALGVLMVFVGLIMRLRRKTV